MKEESIKILQEGASEVGAPLSSGQIGLFEAYLDELQKWNAKLNLTSLTDEIDIVVKHFIDSITPIAYIGLGAFVLDIGSGGGFPGVPIKIARPDIRLLMLESIEKKVSFLNNIIRRLKLKNAKALAQRAEAEAFQDAMAGHLDVVVARAFGETDEILKTGAPYLKKGGKLIVMKGPRWKTESNPDNIRFGPDGLVRKNVVELDLPVLGDRRALLIYEKG